MTTAARSARVVRVELDLDEYSRHMCVITMRRDTSSWQPLAGDVPADFRAALTAWLETTTRNDQEPTRG